MLQNQFQDVTDSSFPKIENESDQGIWAEWEDTDGDGYVDKRNSYSLTWGDVNGDGYVDLWLNNHFGDIRGDISSPPPSLFINQQDGTFENRLDLIQPDSTGNLVRGDRHGSVWADFDNDGDQDLIQLVGLNASNEPSKNKLLINEGGLLVNKADELGVAYPQARSRDPVVFDFNNDGLLDFIHGSLSDGAKNPELPATIFQQNPNGTFSDISAAVDFEFDRNYGLEYVALADFTGDGRLDIFQKQPNAVYDVSSGKFVNITDSLFSGVNLQNDRGLIDLAIADFNGDLIPDVFLPTSGGNGHQLLLSSQTGENSSRVWEDKSIASGVRSVSYQTTDGGGVVVGDFDNDMDIDMFVLNRTGGPDFIFENQGTGTFTASAFSASTPLQSVLRLDLRSVAAADYNNDGFLDLVETTHRNDPTYRLLNNTGNNNNWILIDLEGTVSNRDGIGATVYVTAGGVTQMRQQTGGQHHRAQNDQRVHFGLGDQNAISEIRIKWPSGIEQILSGVTPNQVLQIVESNSQTVANDDLVSTALETAVNIQVLANDNIAPETEFTLSTNGSSSNGSVAVNNNGTPTDGSDDFITYTPNAGFAGTDSFTYGINDASGGTDTATVNVNVIAGDPPVAGDDSGTVDEDAQISLNVLLNDTDADNDLLSLDSVSPGSNGSTRINGNQVVYTPNANFNGTDSFSYTVTDGNGGSANATVNITVTGVNDAPIATNDTLTVDQNTVAQVQVVANDTDIDGDTLTVTSVGTPDDGTTSVSNNQILYTPNPDFIGTDSFTYEINDGNGGTDTATVTVTVTEPGIRLEEGLLSLYTFDEGSGSTIFDVSGVGDPLNLQIDTTTGILSEDEAQIICSCGSCQTCNSQVTWGDGILNVDSHSLISSSRAASKLIDGIKETQEITIEAWIKPRDLTQRGPARIATLSADSGNRNFTLGQQGDDYQVRLRTSTTGNNGVGKTVTSNGAEVTTELSHVVYSRDASGFASLFVNNQLVGSNTIDGDLFNWNAGYQFALANELDSTRHWLGSYDLVAVYNQAFDASEVEQNFLAGASISGPPIVTNTAPVAGDDSGTVDEDAQITLDVLANDSDDDSDGLTIESVSAGNNGTTTISNNQILYTPNPDFVGNDSFTYQVNDGNGGTDTATVNITINPVDEPPVVTNTAPVANDDTTTTDQNTAVEVQVLNNDSDDDSDGLTIDSVSAGSNGTTAISNNQILYTPNPDFTGNDSFTYQINDGNGGTDTATVNIIVNPVDEPPVVTNTAPVANDDNATTDQNTAVQVQVLNNDSDDDSDGLTIDSVSAGSNGTTTISNNQILYTPNPDFVGDDSFTYQVNDGNGGTDTATVNITVNPVDEPPVVTNTAPVANDDNATTDQNTAVEVQVLNNDSDDDSDSLIIESVSAGSDGTTAISNNQILYTPNPDFVGDDSFTYQVNDGNGGTDTATVNVTVTQTDNGGSGDNGGERVEDGLLSLYTFDEGSGNTVFDVSGVGNPLNLQINTLNGVNWGNGILSLNAPNLIASNQAATKLIDGITQTQAITIEAWITPDNLTQRGPARIATLSANVGTRNVTLGQNGDDYQTRLRTTTTGTNGVGKTVTSNGAEVQTELSHVVYSRDANGLAQIYVDNELVGSNTIDGDFSTWNTNYLFALGNELDSSRPWQGSYDLVAIYNQAFDASEVEQNFLAGASISEPPIATNTAPVAGDDSGTVDEDAQITLDVLANDSDDDNDGLTIESVSAGSDGTTAISNNQILYTPNPDFVGNDSFTYQVNDGNGGTDTATVNITVNPVDEPPVVTNTAPVANDDNATTDQNTAVEVQVLNNDSDDDSDGLTIDSVSAGSDGTTAISNNQILYTPNPDFVGNDSFTYQVNDGNGGTDTATVNITVNPVDEPPVVTNTAPVANDDNATTDQNTAVEVQVLNNDSDDDSDGLTIESVSAGSDGTTAISNNQILYTPNPDFVGNDSFTYQVNDGNGGTDTATVNVTVTQTDNGDNGGNGGERVEDGLLSLYTFDEGSGNTVFDVSGVGNPLNLQIDTLTGVNWGDGSLAVNAPNLIASNQAATKLIDGITQTQELTIEAWITPDNLTQRGPARIATLSANVGTRNVTLGQNGDDYQARLRTTTTGTNGVGKTVSSSGGQVETELSHVVYSRDANGLAHLYFDNQLVGFNTIDGDFSTWNDGYQFALANELDGSRSWRGSYDLVAVYNQAFDASEVEQNYLAGADPFGV